MLNGLDLFSGIGGLSRSLAPWVRPLAYCENDRYAQAVLLSRMADGSLERGPIWDDIRTLTAYELGWPWVDIDIIYGGFPCQGISTAGLGKGMADERSGLVSEMLRLVEELRPAFVFFENVPAIRTRGLGRVATTLASLGYDLRWTFVSAAEIGAPHLRKRWFMLAHSNGTQYGSNQGGAAGMAHRDYERIETLADSTSIRGNERTWGDGWIQKAASALPFPEDWWAVEPNVGRVAHGIPHRVDRLRGLGNAVVPAQAREAFRLLIGIQDHQSDIDRYGLEEG